MDVEVSHNRMSLTVTSKTRIAFTCKCGGDGEKCLCQMYEKGSLCKVCMHIKQLNKRKQTSLVKYGVENPAQSERVKDKTKQTNLERRGVEYPMQSPEVQKKSRDTNLEKLGVEYPGQCLEVKEK